ncbi:MAG TPA: protease pro-enzyme activation domain-containing protein, partial [Thermoanaerobaculia bacterium]|nr:protease pro-enzyme activation domain-containing protein [Thermoanaerobaculia bacterium]
MILSLAPRPGAQQQLEKLLTQQHDPASAQYHQWLSPEEFGQRFGATDASLKVVKQWLEGHGFTIDEVAKGRSWINFSGTVAQVEKAFATEIRDYRVAGKLRHANSVDPSIPRALAGIVNGVVTLHNFPRPANHTPIKKLSPGDLNEKFTSGTSHYLSPTDFSTIYNLNSVYSAGTNGSGRTVAIVGRTDIKLADVQFFRSFFGLPANDPVFVHNGTDPGNLGGGEEGEADLDVQWSGAVARNATVKFVISKSTATTDGVDLSAQYIVNNNVGDTMSTSFGQCEATMGATEVTFYNNLWSQAATQGITSFVSAGDAGAAGCNGGGDTTGSGQAVSGLCSTPFNVCVGGTQFNDTASPSTYWSSTNNATTEASVLSYIPEIAWNESGTVAGGANLWSTGGGASNSFSKPSWQVALGVPADGKRDIPDVSLTAAGHDGYLVFQGHTTGTTGLGAVGGTSASSPSFAGLMALIVQKTGSRQGNANTVFYPMAAAQYAGTGPVVYHDITSGNNSVPGTTGFSCTTGYDRVTGLGSVDGAALINNWGGTTPVPDFAISVSPSALTVLQGNAGSATVTTTVSGGFNAAVALSASGQPTGVTVSFSPSSIAAPGSGTSSVSITVASTTVVGTYPITITGTGGSKTHTTTLMLTVSTTAPQQLLGNPGFENGTTATPWVPTTGVINSSASEPPHSGTWDAWMDGYGTTHTDSLYQQVTIPSTATTATLTFWLHIDTAETTTVTAFDTLQVQIRNSSNAVLSTLQTFSNLNKATGYSQKTYNLIAFKGQTIRVYLLAAEDSSLQTSFVVDDFALNV